MQLTFFYPQNGVLFDPGAVYNPLYLILLNALYDCQNSTDFKEVKDCVRVCIDKYICANLHLYFISEH